MLSALQKTCKYEQIDEQSFDKFVASDAYKTAKHYTADCTVDNLQLMRVLNTGQELPKIAVDAICTILKNLKEFSLHKMDAIFISHQALSVCWIDIKHPVRPVEEEEDESSRMHMILQVDLQAVMQYMEEPPSEPTRTLRDHYKQTLLTGIAAGVGVAGSMLAVDACQRLVLKMFEK